MNEPDKSRPIYGGVFGSLTGVAIFFAAAAVNMARGRVLAGAFDLAVAFLVFGLEAVIKSIRKDSLRVVLTKAWYVACGTLLALAILNAWVWKAF